VCGGESECSRDKIIDTALAEESRMAARLLNDAEIEKYKRDFQVYKVQYSVQYLQIEYSDRKMSKFHVCPLSAVGYHLIYCTQYTREDRILEYARLLFGSHKTSRKPAPAIQ